jgi:ADP-ribose pyrophosphatase
MVDESNNPWTSLHQEVTYENPWIKVTEHKVLNPSGKDGIYGVVHYKNLAIGILPVDEHGYTWLVGQYRFPLNQYSWEIPEGGGKHGIDPLDSAKRELLEETGIKASEWKLILQSHLSNSVSDEFALIYLAKGLEFGKSMPEENEELAVKKVHLTEAFQMLNDGIITDSLTVMALLKAQLIFTF